jgi:hypothetical protein
MEVSLLSIASLVFIIVPLVGLGICAAFLTGLWYSRFYYDQAEKFRSRYWPSLRSVVRRLTNAVQKHLFDYTIEYHGEGLEELVAHHQQKESAIFSASPHGLFALASFFNVVTPPPSAKTSWEEVVPCIHRHCFAIPLLREFVLWVGAIDVTKENILQMLEKKSVYVVIGGTREMIKASRIQTKHRGLLKIAFAQKKLVFPILHCGQDEVFYCYSTEWLDRLRGLMCDLTGYAFPTFFTVHLAPVKTHIFPPHNPAQYEKEEEFIDSYYTQLKKYEEEYVK